MSHFVYFAERNGQIKIGFSANPYYRVSALKSSMLGWMRGGRKVEKSIHKLFAKHRIDGEWFVDCEPIRSFIACNTRKGRSAQHFVPTTLTFRVPSETRSKLIEMAQSERRTVSRLVSILLEEQLARRNQSQGQAA